MTTNHISLLCFCFAYANAVNTRVASWRLAKYARIVEIAKRLVTRNEAVGMSSHICTNITIFTGFLNEQVCCPRWQSAEATHC